MPRTNNIFFFRRRYLFGDDADVAPAPSPVAEPTAPVAEPTEAPVAEPTAPVAEPTAPVAEPTGKHAGLVALNVMKSIRWPKLGSICFPYLPSLFAPSGPRNTEITRAYFFLAEHHVLVKDVETRSPFCRRRRKGLVQHTLLASTRTV